MVNTPNFVSLDCERLIGERLPNLLVDENDVTKQNALHDNHFLGKIARWEDFSQEIWNCYTSLNEHFRELRGHDIAVTELGEDGQPAPMVGIRCESEASVHGHWNEYCLRQVATVAQTLDSRSRTVLDLAVEFSSSRTAENNTKIMAVKAQADIVSRTSNLPDQADWVPHFIGHVMTPWAHNIEDMSRNTDLGGEFRRLLGQIAKDMLDEKRKYGFVTTYDQTIFLKQEPVGEAWVLFVSHVFKHNVRSIDPTSGECSFTPTDVQGKMSVRLAMLTLLWLSRTKEDSFADNTTSNWVVSQRLLRLDVKDQGLVKIQRLVSVPDALAALCDTLGPYYGKTDPNFFHGIPEPPSQESPGVPSPSRSQTSLASHVPTPGSEHLVARAGDPPQAPSQTFEDLRSGKSSSGGNPSNLKLPIGQSREHHEQQQQYRLYAAQQQPPPTTPQQAPQLSQPQQQAPRIPRNFAKGLFGKVKPFKKKNDYLLMTPMASQSHDDDEDEDDPTPMPKKFSSLPGGT